MKTQRIVLFVLGLVPALALWPVRAEAKKAPVATVGEAHVYKKVDGRDLQLFVLKSNDLKSAGPAPAIVWFHGGGWKRGSPSQFNAQSAYLSDRGLACISVDYRLLDNKVDPPAICVEDAKSALRWVRAHAAELGIDPNRIAAAGSSAGGHLAAACAFLSGFDAAGDDRAVSAVPNALILFNPVFDNGPDHGYGTERIGERYPEFSPAHNVKKNAPPTLVLNGTEDKLIPISVVERFSQRMKESGSPCEVVLYEGQGHGFFSRKNADGKYYRESLLAADRFLSSLGWLHGPPTAIEGSAPQEDGE